MSKAKFAEPILETIDQLRSRKARPDLARICHMVERRHGLCADDVQTSLAIMVDENLVIKVNYKGNISYRNPAKKRRRRRDLTEERRPAAVMRAKLPKKKLLNMKAAKALVKTKRKRGRPPLNKTKIKQVVKVDEVIDEAMDESAMENAPEDIMDVALRTAETSSHKKVKDDSESIADLSADETASSRSSKTYTGRQKVRVKYELVKGRKSSGKAGSDIHGSVKVSGAESDHTVSETESRNVAASNDVVDTNSTSADSPVASKKIKLIMSKKKLESRRLPGRPRKCLKLKKSISQDLQLHPPTKKTCHEVNLKTDPKMNSLVSGADGQDPWCDFCVGTAASNRNGQPEELLICRDCQAKAHPSCMDYSKELAQRACRSPWQCIDCKTCNVCNDSGDADAMLFCDACDKGYHMSCHQPAVEEKPKGKWVCCQCILEFGGGNGPIGSGENNPENNVDLPVEENISPADGGGASCLPTPNDSPVHFIEEVEESKMCSRLSPPIVVSLPRLATTLTAEVPDASSWSIVDVVKYFSDMGFTGQCEAFREQEIDGRALLLMTRMDVITGLSLRLGPALKIYVHIQRLQRKHSNSH